MALYIYIKQQPVNLKSCQRQETYKNIKFKYKEFIASKVFSLMFSGIFVILGLSMISYAGLPILNWQINYQNIAPEEKIIRPIPVNLITQGKNNEVFAGEKEEVNLNYASNWFEGFPQENKADIKEYTLSVPKLNIYNARVIVGAEELEKSLVHYGGTALPGEYGNSVIFGHSCLPQFYNPKNYSCIFATLPDLQLGDEIYVNIDDIEYKYIVYDFKTVLPDDIAVLEQRFDNYYLTLITCTPPGLDWKRLVVRAKLERI